MEIFEEIITQARQKLDSVASQSSLSELKAHFLGKTSVLNQAMSQLKILPSEQKAEFGKNLNLAKGKITEMFEAKAKEIKDKEAARKIASETIDITLPGTNHNRGTRHPNQIIIDELTSFFVGMGYSVAEGDEVDLDKFNFELLNIPLDHPARDMQDSFYIDSSRLLRSHTSAVQSHVMIGAQGQGPIKVICPGKVYRRDDDDMTHSHQFAQCEGLVISPNVTLGDLMQTLTLMMQKMFGEGRKVRFRPSYFPFTEPSIEVDVSCFECDGKGCDLCKHTGWIEVLGAGMVHPNVLRMNGFDSDIYQGFAFGVGIERLAMLRYGIDDIRKLYNGDVSFLRQFRKE